MKIDPSYGDNISLANSRLKNFAWLQVIFLITYLVPKLLSLCAYFYRYTLSECFVSPLGRKGNGNPLQYYCLGNPMDGGA